MGNEEHIVRYTLDELIEMNARGESLTNWDRLRAMTDEELEASIDWEDEGRFEWGEPYADRFPAVIRRATVCLDRTILCWFNTRSSDSLARIRLALRDYVDAQHLKLAADEPARLPAVSKSKAGIR